MLARAMEPLIAAFHKFGEAKGLLRKGLCTDNTATLQLCQLESGSWRTRHIRLRATIVREALECDDWRAAHLPGLFTSADVATKAVGPLRLADLMRVMDLRTPHIEECEDPPRPSVAVVKAPSVATKALVALLLIAQWTSASASSDTQESDGSVNPNGFGFWQFSVAMLCLSYLLYSKFGRSREASRQFLCDQVSRVNQLTQTTRGVVATTCLCRVCVASPSETSAESSEPYDNWYLVGCIVALVCAWEGLQTLVPRGARKDSVPSSETRVVSEATNILQPIKGGSLNRDSN